jgi:glycosyltransferase involved in cell wall biosynthesis
MRLRDGGSLQNLAFSTYLPVAGQPETPQDSRLYMIDWKRQCAAVIPCFNEAGSIASVIEGVRRHLPNVIVVDDGSSDGTRGEAVAAGAEVIGHSVNCGKGAALRAGWKQARRLSFSWALCLDGDGQHGAEHIPDFFACAEQTSARLVIGNRMGQGAFMPPLRRWTNRWMSRCLSDLTGVALPDSQCGFRLAHLGTVLRLPIAASGFVIESETLVAFLAAGERVEFVPIKVIYGVERSKICPLLDTWRWMRWRAAQLPVSG